MGYELSYIAESKEKIQLLWDTDDYQKTYNEISLWHMYHDVSFELRQYDYSVGTRAWKPMLLLLNKIIITELTARFIQDQSWRSETSHSPKMMRINNNEVNELWQAMRNISISDLEKEAVKTVNQ